jgi:hypothetical protein
MNTTKFANGKFFFNFHSFLFCAGHVLVIAIPSEKKRLKISMSSKVRGFGGINDIFGLYPMFIYYSMVNIQAEMFRQFDKL